MAKHDPYPHIRSAGCSVADALRVLRQFDNSEFPSLRAAISHLNDAAIALVESRMLNDDHTLMLKVGADP